MNAHGRRPRGGLPWVGILLPLALGFVLSVGLAYQTWDAARQHRLTAEATVRDHAAFGAHLIATRLDRRMSQAMIYAFYRVDLDIRGDETRWPDVEGLRIGQEIERCAGLRPEAERVFFRWIAGGDLELAGPAHPDLRAWLLDWIPAAAGSHPETRSFGLRFGAPGLGPAGVAFRIFRTDAGTAVYGLDNCLRGPEGPLIEGALAEAEVLPPALVGPSPHDTLLHLAVLDGAGRTIGDAGREVPYGGPYAPVFVGRTELQPAAVWDGLTVEVRLSGATAERLVIGGLPRSRLPEALGLVALTALLLAVAARQLRRGQELVRMRERFVANVSHELRTPIQQILLFSDLLRLERIDDAGERGRALAVIHRETRRLMGLVENLLAFGRSDAPARPDLRRDALDLHDLAVSTAESFRPIADERDAGIVVHGGEALVTGDADALHRVLTNLLDNAIKYGPEAQTVRIEIVSAGGEGRIAVEDEGPGIPDAARERVWLPHVRLAGDAGVGAGQGIGLSIARDLVERMGGRVTLETAETGGARFTISLPAAAR